MNVIALIIEEVKRDAAGAAIISDWIGSGGVPVSQCLAESRANICKGCPENVEMLWWKRAKHAVADTIKNHLEVKSRVSLRVSGEDKLGMCKVCGCCLPLAVWVPSDKYSAHTTNDMLGSFPKHCWKKSELSA